MSCLTCPTPVPIVSLRIAKLTASLIPQDKRLKVMYHALEWLVTRHEGLTLYLGVNGRNYTNDEKVAISKELGTVQVLSCPFLEGDNCILDRLPPAYTLANECGKSPYLWLPTAMAKLVDEDTLREVVNRKEVADAKVAMLTRFEAL